MEKKTTMKMSEESLNNLWNTMKKTNTHTVGFSKEEKRDKWTKSLFEEIMAENIQIQEVQEIPIEVNPKESTSRHYNQTVKSQTKKEF